MEHFDHAQLQELVEASSDPAISIYMPFERTELTKKSTRLLYRGAVDDARKLLMESEKLDRKSWQPLIDRLMAYVEDQSVWNASGHGLAFFAAPGFERVVHLPMKVERSVMVGSNFHTRPLLEWVASPERYYVLAIGQDEVALWEGSSMGLTRLAQGDIPTSMSEVLQLEEEKGQDPLSFHSSFRHSMGREVHHKNGGRGLPAPIFSGGGGGKDRQDAYMKEFLLRVDEAVARRLRGREGPLILAAVDFHHPMYQELSQIKTLAREGIHGNVHYWGEKELHEQAWPIARQVAETRIDEALALWERAYGMGSAEQDPAAIARLIIESRVHLVLIDRDHHIWGNYDVDQGTVRIDGMTNGRTDPGAHKVDVLDEFAEQVIFRGGQALLVPTERMPTRSGVAAILRGSNRGPSPS